MWLDRPSRAVQRVLSCDCILYKLPVHLSVNQASVQNTDHIGKERKDDDNL